MQNSRGEPFGTSDSWTKYIQSIFKQLANVAISSNALRSSFVTDLLTSRNRPSDDLLAEVAFAMRHSSREQSRTYDQCRGHPEDRYQGRSLQDVLTQR